MTFSLATTNLAEIEAKLKKIRRDRAIITSLSVAPELMETVPPLVAVYGAKLVALTMGRGMIPVKADERVEIALEALIPRALEVGMDISRPCRCCSTRCSIRTRICVFAQESRLKIGATADRETDKDTLSNTCHMR